jgi:hypothetical protein
MKPSSGIIASINTNANVNHCKFYSNDFIVLLLSLVMTKQRHLHFSISEAVLTYKGLAKRMSKFCDYFVGRDKLSRARQMTADNASLILKPPMFICLKRFKAVAARYGNLR